MMAVRCDKDSELWQAVEAARHADKSWLPGAPPPPPAGVLAVEQYGLLRDAVLAKCEELTPRGTPAGRTTGLYHADGDGCTAIVNRPNEDGTDTVWQVTAYYHSSCRVPLSVQVHGHWTDNHDQSWQARLDGDRSGSLVVDHRWYTIGKGNGGGFGGRLFRFRLLDTWQEIESRDMGFCGVIPPAWRDRLPDTAVMLEGFHPTFTG
jgi:hypothetical protein